MRVTLTAFGHTLTIDTAIGCPAHSEPEREVAMNPREMRYRVLMGLDKISLARILELPAHMRIVQIDSDLICDRINLVVESEHFTPVVPGATAESIGFNQLHDIPDDS